MRHDLRIVVQYIDQGRESAYRLIAYGKQGNFDSKAFRSIEDVLKALQCVTSDVHERDFVIPESHGTRTRVVFAGNFVLDDSQMSDLGLVRTLCVGQARC